VTAYDVFYSYLAIVSEDTGSPYRESVSEIIRDVFPTDPYTIVFTANEVDCTTLDALNFPIIPAHVFEPDFPTTETAFEDVSNLDEQYLRWTNQSERDFSFMVGHPFDYEPPVTAGVYQLDEVRPTEFIRLVSDDGAQGFEYVDVPDTDTQVDWFLSGDLNLIVSPPYERRQDIRAAADVQIAEYPSTLWYFIGFNLADPLEPRGTVDEDGNLLDQGQHPLFSDVRVRRAIQMAIDVNALIEASVYGAGTVIPADQPPVSWAYHNALSPIPYDPVGAAQLLDEAGWRDWNRDGVRECHNCMVARPGTPLSFSLLYNGDSLRYLAMSRVIEQQLRLIGVDVFGQPTDGSAFNQAIFQGFDAILSGWREPYPVNPDHAELFTQAGDVVGEGLNVISYHNPVVEQLFEEARTMPACDPAARAEIYREIQTVLQEDQPYAWLFSPHDMVAARGSISGFNPYPQAPLWNVREWTIVE
jgi:peptide/nickel transport system substrate-binding protein